VTPLRRSLERADIEQPPGKSPADSTVALLSSERGLQPARPLNALKGHVGAALCWGRSMVGGCSISGVSHEKITQEKPRKELQEFAEFVTDIQKSDWKPKSRVVIGPDGEHFWVKE